MEEITGRDEIELLRKVQMGMPDFPTERWKEIAWWVIFGLGAICWLLYRPTT
jgi:hypothetical protein